VAGSRTITSGIGIEWGIALYTPVIVKNRAHGLEALDFTDNELAKLQVQNIKPDAGVRPQASEAGLTRDHWRNTRAGPCVRM
jgi:hypothetical protein